jgi:hypothetical protein
MNNKTLNKNILEKVYQYQDDHYNGTTAFLIKGAKG